MAWKTTIPWFGAVATLTAGYVWTRWARARRPGLPQASQTATPKLLPDEIPALPFAKLELDLDAMAEDDAQRAMEPERSFLEPELDIDWDDPEIDVDDSGTTAHVTEHLHATDEPYDAVNAEDLGAAWLRRATQSEPLEAADPEGTWEGATIIDAPPSGSPTTTDEEIARRARTAEAARRTPR